LSRRRAYGTEPDCRFSKGMTGLEPVRPVHCACPLCLNGLTLPPPAQCNNGRIAPGGRFAGRRGAKSLHIYLRETKTGAALVAQNNARSKAN